MQTGAAPQAGKGKKTHRKPNPALNMPVSTVRLLSGRRKPI
jgi:hypothetical protein